jgi:hypothetical protein
VVHADSKPLRLIGNCAGPTAPDWPETRNFVDPTWDRLERETIADYLQPGVIDAAFGGLSTCRFCGRKNGALELSDGVWVWPDGLAHYVDDHDVRLPAEFVDHALGYLDRLGHADRDVTWWRAQASPGGGRP